MIRKKITRKIPIPSNIYQYLISVWIWSNISSYLSINPNSIQFKNHVQTPSVSSHLALFLLPPQKKTKKHKTKETNQDGQSATCSTSPQHLHQTASRNKLHSSWHEKWHSSAKRRHEGLLEFPTWYTKGRWPSKLYRSDILPWLVGLFRRDGWWTFLGKRAGNQWMANVEENEVKVDYKTEMKILYLRLPFM